MKQQPISNNRHLLFRIQTIHNLVSFDRYPTTNMLADKLEVNARTIRRDISFMRDILSLPIEYNASAKGYNYTAHVSAFPTASFNVREAGLIQKIIDELDPCEAENAAILQTILDKLIKLGGLHFSKKTVT